MTDEDLEMFHRLLDSNYTKSIYSAGKAFQESLNSMAADIEFSWESNKKSIPLNRLREEELLSYLKPFPTAPQNVYYSNKNLD